MAKSASKGKTKQPTKASITSNLKSNPPSPYARPPPALRPFLETLNPKHVYITHVDMHPKGDKMRAFFMTAFLNVAILLLLMWRAVAVLPWYAQVLLGVWGYAPERQVDIPGMGMTGFLNATFSRAMTFFVDFALVKFFVPWPLDFFVGPGSPTSWRMSIGFQDKEITVRKSRKWDQDLPSGWLSESSDGAVYMERIMPAIDRQWMSKKTGYLMQDKSWDLDMASMVIAHDLTKAGKSKLEDFQKTVMVYSEEFGWLVWQVWKLDEGGQDEGRRKIGLFKDKLTALGKEDLFYRWIEVIQFETSQDGGFTEERQAKAMREAKQLFQSHGLDFDKIWKEVAEDPAADGTEGM